MHAATHVAPLAVVTLYAVAHCEEPTLACLTTGPVPRFCSIQLLTESVLRLRAASSAVSALHYDGLAVCVRDGHVPAEYRHCTLVKVLGTSVVDAEAIQKMLPCIVCK